VKPLGRVFIQVYPWFHSLHGSHLRDFIQEPFFHLKRDREWVQARLEEFVSLHPEQRDVVMGTMWPEYCRLNGYSARRFLSDVADAGFCVERVQCTITEEQAETAPPDVALADIMTSGSMVLLRPGKPFTNDEVQIARSKKQFEQPASVPAAGAQPAGTVRRIVRRLRRSSLLQRAGHLLSSSD
jgi:hypothetical protein